MPLVAIDVTSYLASRTGVGVCVGQLVHALLAGPPEERRYEFRLCAVSAGKDAEERVRGLCGDRRLEVRIRRFAQRLIRPLVDSFSFPSVESMFGAADVYHAGHLLVPASRHTPMVMTIYDVTPIRFPEHHIQSNLFTRKQLRCWLDRVDLAIVPSDSTGRDLQEITGVAQNKIRVIPLGVREVFRPLRGRGEGDSSRWGVTADYILAVGAPEPRKNLVRLVQALRLLKDRFRIPHKLAIVGPEGWKDQPLHRAIQELGLSSEVVFTGFVPEADLNALYNRAALLVYPSLYEGFGLPPLEAMAAGCPVAVARVSSLPEVVGESGVYFDPLQVEDIAAAIHRVLDSEDLRKRLKQAGIGRSRSFSWARTARETLRVYEEARAIRPRRC